MLKNMVLRALFFSLVTFFKLQIQIHTLGITMVMQIPQMFLIKQLNSVLARVVLIKHVANPNDWPPRSQAK